MEDVTRRTFVRGAAGFVLLGFGAVAATGCSASGGTGSKSLAGSGRSPAATDGSDAGAATGADGGEAVEIEGDTEDQTMMMNVTCNGQTVTYELNDSAAARGLFDQLPLTLEVEPFSNNEQTFYPPQALDCSDAPLAGTGGAGVLAYYEPWADVVMFYGDFSGNGSLYELGHATAGAEHIAGMTGTIEVARA